MACSAAPATVLSQTDLYVDRGPPAAAQAQEWAEQGRDADAERMRVIAAQPIAEWLTSPTGSIRADVEQFVGRARGSARCWSPTTCRPGTAAASRAAGPDGADYRAWVREIAGALGGGRAVIVLEPDAVPHEPTGCVAPEMVAQRSGLLSDAVVTLADAGATVYWTPADIRDDAQDMLDRHVFPRVERGASPSGTFPPSTPPTSARWWT